MTSPVTAASPNAPPGEAPPGAERVLTALDAVRDPELDEPITSLGFVTSCRLSAAGDAQIRLRLPTYFCAPNFAFLMVADAYDAVTALPGVRRAEIVLEDHFAATAINDGVAARAGFVTTFDGEAVSELDGLRADFLRKAVLAGTDQVCRPLLAAGADPARLQQLTLGEVPDSRPLRRLRERRAELGLPGRRRRTAAHRPEDGRGGGTRIAAAAPAQGQADPDQPGSQRQHLPGHAAAPLRHTRTR